MKEGSANIYPNQLVKEGFVNYSDKRINKKTGREVETYTFEDYTFQLNEESDFQLSFAPGYVKYNKKFIKMYENFMLGHKEAQSEIYNLLVGLLRGVFNTVKRHGDEMTPRSIRCKWCGYDHEIRDFIRATLLHLMDDLEKNYEYIEFIKEFVDESAYQHLRELSERDRDKNPLYVNKRRPKEPSKANYPSDKGSIKKQESSNDGHEKFKRMVDLILKERPEISAENIRDMLDEKKRKIGSAYLTDHSALCLVCHDLGII
jgi:predicted Zn-ribbon and HTH transcriptional regulator